MKVDQHLRAYFQENQEKDSGTTVVGAVCRRSEESYTAGHHSLPFVSYSIFSACLAAFLLHFYSFLILFNHF